MKRLLFALLLSFVSTAQAAWTELYVRADSAGGGDCTADTDTGVTAACTWDEMLAYGGTTTVAGVRWNIKAGAYNRTTSADAFTVTVGAPVITAPMMLRGFNSSPGDLEANGRTGGTGALVLTNFPVITYTTGTLTLPVYTILQQLDIEGAPTSGVVITNTNSQIRRCRVRNTHANSGAAFGILDTDDYVIVVDNDIFVQSTNVAAVALQVLRGVAHSNRVSGAANGGGVGIVLGTFATAVGNQIFDIQKGVEVQGLTGIVANNSFRNVAGSHVRIFGSSASIINNVAWGTGGVNSRFFEAAPSGVRSYIQIKNAVGNMVADVNEGDWLIIDEIALSADPFTSSTDLTPNSTSGGGADIKGVGLWPHLDLGAIQVEPAVGGGSTGFIAF